MLAVQICEVSFEKVYKDGVGTMVNSQSIRKEGSTMNKVLIFTVIFAVSCSVFGQTWQIPQGSAVIDANLSDWADSPWIDMDVIAYGLPSNISNAKMAVRWDTTNLYMAITCDDADLQLSQGCLSWNGQDDIEVYVNVSNNDPVNYSSINWVTAQHYFIGANGDNATGLSSTPASPAGAWSNLGSVNPLPDAVNWPNTNIEYATNVTGNTITYEMKLPAYSNMAIGEVKTLTAGDIVGLDAIVADRGLYNYGWVGINADGGKSGNAGQFQDWELVTEIVNADVHYTFQETAPGTWKVFVEISGEDTAGLSAYEIWVDNVAEGSVSFAENTLGSGTTGFSSNTLLYGEIGESFNVGNHQNAGDAAIEGIGMVAVNEAGVVLDAQALIGILTTPTGLTEDDFRVAVVGLLDETGGDFLNTNTLVPTIEVIQFSFLLGDANGDGVVSAGDYASVQANFGNTGTAGGGLAGDANGDGVVSAGDYASVQANFGNTSGVGLVPEPATISFLLMGTIALIRRK